MTVLIIGIVDPWGQVVRECEAGNLGRRSIAMTYAFGLRQDIGNKDGIAAANAALGKRFKVKTIEWIKVRAWAYHEGRIVMGSPQDRP